MHVWHGYCLPFEQDAANAAAAEGESVLRLRYYI
jgi:hypothetical protein